MKNLLKRYDYTVHQHYEFVAYENDLNDYRICVTVASGLEYHRDGWMAEVRDQSVLWITSNCMHTLAGLYYNINQIQDLQKYVSGNLLEIAEYKISLYRRRESHHAGRCKYISAKHNYDGVAQIEYKNPGIRDNAVTYYLPFKEGDKKSVIVEEKHVSDNWMHALYKVSYYPIEEAFQLINNRCSSSHLLLIKEFPSTYGEYWHSVEHLSLSDWEYGNIRSVVDITKMTEAEFQGVIYDEDSDEYDDSPC